MKQERTLESNSIFAHRLNRVVGNDSLATLEDWRHADFLPLYGDLRRSVSFRTPHTGGITHLGRLVDANDRFTNLRTNTYADRSAPAATMVSMTHHRPE
jgi:hypothetical protein